MKYFNCFFILLLTSIKVFSQESTTYFEHLTTNEGLSSNNINTLLQDHFGFLWIGTANGLNRYDGQDVQRFFHSYRDTNSVTGDDILHLAEINEKYLFIATTRGLSIFNLQTSKFQNSLIHLQGPSSLSGHYISNIFQDQHQQIYISFDNQFDVFDSSFKFIYRITDLPNAEQFKSIMLKDIQEDAQGRLWILTFSGLALFDPKTKEIINRKNNPDHWKIFDFDCAFFGLTLNKKTGLLYFSCWNLPLYKFEVATNEITETKIQDPVFKKNYYSAFRYLLPDQSGNIWCGCDAGLCKVRLNNDSSQIFVHSDQNPLSISSNTISALLKDHERNLWIGTDNGLNRLSLKGSPFYSYSSSPGIGNVSSYKSTLSCVVKKDQNLWFGTWNNYLWKRNDDGKWLQVKVDPYNSTTNTIWNMCKTHDGNLWVATEGGLYISDDSDNNTFHSPINYPDSLKHQKTLMVFEDSHHDMWACLHGGVGLLHYDSQLKNWDLFRNDFSPPNNLPAKQFINIAEDRNGNIWIGNYFYSDAGIACWNRRTGLFKLYGMKNGVPANPLGERTNYLFVDKNNILWIGSVDYGLIRFDIATEQYKVYSHDDGLPDNEVNTIVQDHEGFLWLATSNGLARFDPLAERCTNFGFSYGLPVEKFNSQCFYDTTGNEIYLTTQLDVVYFNPDEVTEDKSSSPALITSIKSGGENFFSGNNRTATINYSKNAIEFSFTAINFRDGRNTQYAYHLDGYDKDWIYCGNRHFASYANLSPGNYTFRVKAANGAGLWNEQAAIFPFIISPPFYFTWWFIAACILLTASLLYFIYRVRITRLLALERLRSRISRDLHDEVGSTLSSITMLSKLAKTKMNDEQDKLRPLINRIEEGSQRMTENMQDIVWAVNPSNDSMQIIIARMRSFAMQTLDCRNIQLHFEADKELAEQKLDLEERQDFYLIFKESINNTAKYSEARNVKVEIKKNGKHYCMIIHDDGKGFDVNHPASGNGLINMKKRAEKMNAALKITSVPGEGTITELKF